MTKVCFGSVPKDSGTFTFYRNLRPALREHGVDLRCVAVGWQQAELWEEPYADEGCVLLAPDMRSVKKQSMAFVEWCELEGVQIVMGINSEPILAALPHLPEKVRCMARCANAFDHGYRITMSCRDRLARVVATTPRLERDLVSGYGADPARMALIPNGIAPEPFEEAARAQRGAAPVLRLGFLGRLEHNQKGVFHLPKIVAELKRRKVAFHMRIAGKGKHGPRLRKEFAEEVAKGEVEFIGALTPAEVPGLLAEIDVFVFTSHFEGCPNALLEAMMAGCVPVCWLIDGITDFLVMNGETGFICPMDDHRSFAERVTGLDANREQLRTLSRQGGEAARERFSNARTAESYAALFQTIVSGEAPAWRPRPWSAFEGEPNFRHSWTGRVPAPFRRVMRALFRR